MVVESKNGQIYIDQHAKSKSFLNRLTSRRGLNQQANSKPTYYIFHMRSLCVSAALWSTKKCEYSGQWKISPWRIQWKFKYKYVFVNTTKKFDSSFSKLALGWAARLAQSRSFQPKPESCQKSQGSSQVPQPTSYWMESKQGPCLSKQSECVCSK